MRDRKSINLSVSTISFGSNGPYIPSSSSTSTSTSTTSVSAQDAAEKGRFLVIPASAYSDALPSPLLKKALQESQSSFYRRCTWLYSRYTVISITLCILFLLLEFTSVLDFLSQVTVWQPFDAIDRFTDGLSLSGSAGPVVVVDAYGSKKWTISIPAKADFPLLSSEYNDICAKSRGLSTALRRSSGRYDRSSPLISRRKQDFDVNYMDIEKAQSLNLIPYSEDEASISTVGPAKMDMAVCSQSLTFILEGDEAGFGKTLMALWLSYGIAKREQRTFFIDDSRWLYGRYTSFFPMPPQPLCAPPPASRIVPCPHQAAHLAVSASTMDNVFGPESRNRLKTPHRSDLTRQRDIFALTREGYDNLFGLVSSDDEYLKQRVADIKESAFNNNHNVIGLHIRRGDRHPFEDAYADGYIPLERFSSTALDLLNSPSKGRVGGLMAKVSFIVGSDDPDTPYSTDLTTLPASHISNTSYQFEQAQTRIQLASKRIMSPSAKPQSNGGLIKHIDEAVGWEGGFFSSLFRALGRPSGPSHLTFASAREHRIQVEERLKSKSSVTVPKEDENVMVMRELVGRAYLLDLSVLAKSDKIICTTSSASCRVLAVMMGWNGVKAGNWINIDDGRVWSWDGEV